ncbi:cbb3-type cytochrome c oxidase subunit I [Niabella terrae]
MAHYFSSLQVFNSLLASPPNRALPFDFSFSAPQTVRWLLLLLALIVLCVAIVLAVKVSALKGPADPTTEKLNRETLQRQLTRFSSQQLQRLLALKKKNSSSALTVLVLISIALLGAPVAALAQQVAPNSGSALFGEAGILITIVLLLIPILAGLVLLMIKVDHTRFQIRNKRKIKQARELAEYLETQQDPDLLEQMEKRKAALDFQPSGHALSGALAAEDDKGLLQLNEQTGINIVAPKKRALPRPNIDPALSRMILWYMGCATFWLLFGTTVGEYLGIKFVAPEADHLSWLSFGRLRPVHTNAVFWGWASLGMIGLGYYIVPRVSNTRLAHIKYGWYTLILINASVIIGTLCLMAGINNGGGEYREYIWPVMLLFAIGLVLTLINYIQTIARRTTREIYISNWYMVAAIIFTIVIALAAYIPYWQNGLGETIIQGYYMHQGVGMWFMLFTLGIVYYFLPQQLNKPIYSYSLGILAFWTQILFYTLIGTHHFVFSSIPWWLQTVAIVGSAGMAIPVIAGTTNFLMTFKGAWYKIKDSYTLPFFLVGIIFYFTGSMQGTAEAFRTTNLIWHFTDFTVAHSHLTMYGIITFFLWACMYAIIPRLTGKEAPQILIGAHFWLAFIGMLFYTIPLMYGSTLKGLLWIQGKPFIDSVTLMAPYWLWRAIGGSLMWLSHILFAYNVYKMLRNRKMTDVAEAAIRHLETKSSVQANF